MHNNLYCGIAVIIGALLAPFIKGFFDFIKGLLKKQEDKFITYNDFNHEKDILYNTFVKKQDYEESKSEMQKDFEKFDARFGKIEVSQTEIKVKLAEQGVNLDYIKKAIDSLPKRTND